MKLRGTDFGQIFDASGAEGFFGEGYRHHKILKHFGLDLSGVTFVVKTTTLEKNPGNMPMEEDGITPKELFPKCIRAKFFKGVMLNAVGLSGPGAKALLDDGRWQAREKPFGISFMAIGKTPEARTAELTAFVKLLSEYLPGFRAPIFLQMNYSCPNVGLEQQDLIDEVKTGLQIASELGIPLMPKFNVLVSPFAAKEISRDYNCDALCMSNTIPWGKLPDKINWKKLFGSNISPLAKFGGGGLSGKPLLELVIEWVRQAKYAGIGKPINAGGGIFSAEDLALLYYAGASSVFIGTVVNLRPWRVRGIVHCARQIF
ncbi:MAG: hypothetical protein ABSA74_00445 [Candidatus Staskawiczbacteria bacterium]|jgi:dihydroorotate dehydrogenase